MGTVFTHDHDIDTESTPSVACARSVDELDRLLVELLNRRAKLALAVAREKFRLGLAVRAPGREREVIAHVRQANAGPLDELAVTGCFGRSSTSPAGSRK